MTDRELLEAAAKAASIGPVLCYESRRNLLRIGTRSAYILWRPLTDDGDAMRLAVKLGMIIDVRYTGVGLQKYNHVAYWRLGEHNQPFREMALDEYHDPLAATRRAIVRAAAAIGEAK